RGQPRLPQQLAGTLVKGADEVVRGRADEDQAARGDRVAADIEDAGLHRQVERDVPRTVVARGAERTLPHDLARDEIDRDQLAPRRRIARHPPWIHPWLHAA